MKTAKRTLVISAATLLALSGCVGGTVQRVVGTAPPSPVVATAPARSMPHSISMAVAQCVNSTQGAGFNAAAMAAAGFSSSDFNPRELTLKLPDGQGFSVTYPTKGAGGCNMATTYPAFGPQLFAQSLSDLKLRGYKLRDDGGNTYTASNGQQTLTVTGSEANPLGSPRYSVNISPVS